MGRAPCCDKANVKKGPWSPEEDAKLKAYIEQHGTGGNWIALPQKIGLKRCGKSCRLRWLNYLRPNIKHGGFSEEEEKIICSLYISIGSRWSIIAAQLPGRTDNDIKNYWNTRLKKKLLGKQRKEQQHSRNSYQLKMRSAGNESMVNPPDDNNNQISPYWPELPVVATAAQIPYSSQQQGIVDSQASMRRLLVKLGGKFCDDHDHVVNIDGSNITDHLHQHHQFPNDHSSSTELYEQTVVQMHSSTSPPIFANLQMLQGQGSFYSEMGYGGSINPQRLDGMEFLYGEDSTVISTCRALNASCESETMGMGWGGYTDTSSLVFPPAPEYGGNGIIQQGMLHQYANSSTHELRYPAGAQQ